jgi:hypothetical protein
MDPEVWGPHAWIVLHTITFNYPETPCLQDKNNIRLFFKYFSYQTPCNKCKNHFIKYMNKNPLTDKLLSSKDDLIDWLINAHNKVNKRNKKRLYSREEVISYYEELYNPSYKSYFYNYKFILFMLILILVLLIYFKNFKY